ncbi:hypothetical protein CC85DRAFT_21515 [Cutaneotrichosporon oleaginosum]|uniref:Uncharacterized protein n=1 Tax=Cutaneotrichosporon oleaginosum TaxID=879819 RepID=A0A0J0XC43_9TREE|nr:uncharacterized protein CC85DRAFT_21515 [Cutaneotrichosporon oleaginosum]KLT38630.1 hypothetical protein CC85DRAFT_21515 [Cutaneotrichosporon oleaginosum]TXT08103.1 hypothetical protein COLE_05027 [Cutaneotrichosporon oleaginosum]
MRMTLCWELSRTMRAMWGAKEAGGARGEKEGEGRAGVLVVFALNVSILTILEDLSEPGPGDTGDEGRKAAGKMRPVALVGVCVRRSCGSSGANGTLRRGRRRRRRQGRAGEREECRNRRSHGEWTCVCVLGEVRLWSGASGWNVACRRWFAEPVHGSRSRFALVGLGGWFRGWRVRGDGIGVMC